ncbi:MAG: 2'-5' RNA ligase family protein [Lentisphaeria bacterium]|nr:2'-5' RNA ligase family protein [Lentisphaeria bacterium]
MNEINTHSNTICHPSYIVLNIPSPMAEVIQSLRAKYDVRRASLPAEITLTGSSGTGLIEPGQDIEMIAAEMNRVAKTLQPFTAQFSKLERFPNTDIYFLTLNDDTMFNHARLALENTAIRFQPTPYPYTAHCTLKLRSEPTDAELLEMFFMDVPKTPFQLSQMSLYSLPDTESCELLHTVEFGR